MAGRLQGKVALVLGAGAAGEEPGGPWGNGKAAAVLFAREGAFVACADLDPAAAEATAAAIRAEGGRALPLACDVTRSDQLAAAVEAVVRAEGRVDVLHNNVGFVQNGGPLELTEAQWRRGFDLNVTGAFLACQAVLPVMLAQGKGAIVNVSSLASIRHLGYAYSAYAAAKAALNHFTVGLALQYARDGIRANAVLPGLIDTPLIYRQIAGHYESRESMVAARHAATPMGRMGTAWDVAHAAAFLASDEAAFITGVCLPVDGGQSCRA